MNHCRDCNSDYSTPGTCNCFAVGGKRWTQGVPYVPYIPYEPYRRMPYVPTPFYPGWWGIFDPQSGNVTGGQFESNTTGTVTLNGGAPLVSDTVKIENVKAQWSYCNADAKC